MYLCWNANVRKKSDESNNVNGLNILDFNVKNEKI